MRAFALAFGLSCAASVAVAQDFTTLKGHGGPIMGLAVGPAGQVASASFDNSVGLWVGRTPTWLEGHEAAVTALTFGPEGALVSGGDDFAVRLWSTPARELGRHKGKVASVAIAPDGSTVASGSWDGSIRLWSMAGDDTVALPQPGASVNAVAFSASGDHLFAATAKGAVLRYDLRTQETPLALVKHGFGVNRMVVTRDWLAYGAVDGGTRIVHPETGAQIADFTLDRRPILSLAYHAGTHQLAVGDGEGFIMVVDTQDWRVTRDYRATRQGPVWALAFSPDGETIYAGGLDDVIYAWPVALLDQFDATMGQERSFLQDPATLPNGERQFARKCSICHAVTAGPSRKAGPTLHGVFGRQAGTVAGYRYSEILDGSGIVWTEDTIDALFDEGPDHYIPGSKMPMQIIAKSTDRADLIAYLKQVTTGE